MAAHTGHRNGGGNGHRNGNGKTSGKAITEQLMMRGRTLRVAVVGCGYWGPKVIRASSALPQIEIAALIDRDLALAENLQRQFPAARTATSLTEALADDSIDAVLIATNPATHVDLAAEALAAGKHTLVEKPLALSSDECRALGRQAIDSDLI